MFLMIVGGGGFIGSHLCELIEAAGKEFTMIDKAGSRRFSAACRQVRLGMALGRTADDLPA